MDVQTGLTTLLVVSLVAALAPFAPEAALASA